MTTNPVKYKPIKPHSKPIVLVALWRWMDEFHKTNHFKPSYKDIGDHFNTSTSHARYYLNAMVEAGIGEQPTYINGNGKVVVPARSFILLPLEDANEDFKARLAAQEKAQ